MPRILHIGVGNFHRAHQAVYTAQAAGNWRITGVVMGNTALFDAMADGSGYALGIRGPQGMTRQQITVHDRMLLARRDPQAVIDAFVDPDLHIVTLTITEKGYCIDQTTGTLDLAHPAIVEDLAGDPTSAVGLLAHGLACRAAAGLSALTVISCDNLSGNGRKTRNVVEALAAHARLPFDLATRFPDSMVDRITPATPDVHAPIVTEEFSEWVIEDNFAGLRPNWETAGAEFTPDVGPFEMRKLRLLNAAHSWLAYAGQLTGHTYVHEAMANPELSSAVGRLWDDAQSTLPDTVQASTPAYRQALVERFAVTEMRHELAQIGADGSLKLRERIAPLIAGSKTSDQATKTVAAWVAFVIRKIEMGDVLVDPNADEISDLVKSSVDLMTKCKALSKLIGLPEASDNWLANLTRHVDEYSNGQSV